MRISSSRRSEFKELSTLFHKYGNVFSKNWIPAFAGIQRMQQQPFDAAQGRERHDLSSPTSLVERDRVADECATEIMK